MSSPTVFKNYINGQFVLPHGGQTFESLNPHDTTQVVACFADSDASDVDAAVKAARTAFDNGSWSKLLPSQRAEVLLAIAKGIEARSPELVAIEMADAGSVFHKAQADVALTAKYFKTMAKLAQSPLPKELPGLKPSAGVTHYLQYDPIGVCALITPWNFPLLMAAWKIAPALAAGCTVVFKPSEETSHSAMVLAEIIDATGLPNGVFNVVTGTGVAVGEPLVAHPLVDKVSFTGSTAVGKHIMKLAAEGLKPVTLECGGKSANIVLPSAPLQPTLDGIIFSIFYHGGQCCTAASRLLIPRSELSRWQHAILARVKDIKQASPENSGASFGPLVSKKQQQRVLHYIQLGIEQGATLLCGGKVPDDDVFKNGCYVEPTVFTNVSAEMTIAQEEIFGPVLCIMPYDTVEEAITIANNTSYGLAGGVWGADVEQCKQVANQLQAGTVWINEYLLVNEKAPFGGYKQSGIGREHGPDALKPYLEVKHIHCDALPDRDKKFWYDGVLKPQSIASAVKAEVNKLLYVAKEPELLPAMLKTLFPFLCKK